MNPDGVTDGAGTMDAERFARVRVIFEAALERPARERQAFVEGACVGDAALLREVEVMLAADATALPLLDRPSSAPSSSAPDEGRFPAGTVLAGRYRILGLLGQGGMGEVYRAHDLILNQIVALKFLAPAHLSEAALARFRNEVRVARQVSHPNVCRVYDLGMVEGLHFLSMEYIDGEDLASLLRRIGRLPQDTAIEFTRKMCAGLSAAHERGVLHRDLKPANIMIDGRGQPRITDFGLAALAEEIPLSDLRSGTPAYMSPEQKVGKDVTVRSDLYSLGLVLYEMFTGRPRSSSNATDLVKDLDPAIERLILRCLEDDPKRRPPSAFAVAMALPGADPIAAALAAGETPSPEMVAASQEKEGFSPRAAWACFGAIVALVALLLTTFSPGLTANRYVPHPPSVLAFRAQETLKQLGYPDAPVSVARGFECCNAGVLRMLGERTPQDRAAILASSQPAVLLFWYRQHRRDILPDLGPEGRGLLTYARPANTEPGMIRLRLDPYGRLVEFEARPQELSGTRSSPIDPSILFAEAGLDRTLFSEATPREPPPMAFDQHLAWAGSYGNGRTESVRVSAAFWEGRPVYFRVRGDPWEEPVGLVRPAWQDVVAVLLYLTLLVGSLTVAVRHIRVGRGDRRGSARVAVAAFLMLMAGWAMTGPHVARVYEFQLFSSAISFAAFYAGMIWALYMAVEPYVRRHWPDALISWTRVLSGQFRNPLVASHVLVGVCLEVAFIAAVRGVFWVVRPPTRPRMPISIAALQGGLVPLGAWLQMAVGALAFVMAFVLIIVLLRLLLRKLGIADFLGAILIGALLNPTGAVSAQGDAVVYVIRLLIAWAWLWSLRRFGLLSVLVAIQCDWLLASQLFGGWDSWYVGWSLLPWVVMLSVAAWALWVILSARHTRLSESPAF